MFKTKPHQSQVSKPRRKDKQLSTGDSYVTAAQQAKTNEAQSAINADACTDFTEYI